MMRMIQSFWRIKAGIKKMMGAKKLISSRDKLSFEDIFAEDGPIFR
jgi:hypothetical protein